MKLRTIAPIAVAFSLAFTSSVQAQDPATPSFDHAGFGYLSFENEAGSEAEGFTIDAAVSFADDWFVMTNGWALYEEVTGTPQENIYVAVDASVGYKLFTTSSSAFYVSAGLSTAIEEQFYYGDSYYDDSDSGYNYGIGVRQRLTDAFQIDLDAREIKIWDTTIKQYTATGRVFFSDGFSVDVSYRQWDNDIDSVGFSLAWHW